MDGHIDQPSFGTTSAVITRADGTVVDVGVIAAHYRSPWRRLWWRLWGLPAVNRRIKRINRAHAGRQRGWA